MPTATEKQIDSLDHDRVPEIIGPLQKFLDISVDFNSPEPPGSQFWNELESGLLKSLGIHSIKDIEQGRKSLTSILKTVIEEGHFQLLTAEIDPLVDQLMDHFFGLGILDLLLRDDSIVEILINSSNEIYYERKGRLHRASVSFWSDNHLKHVIDRFCARNHADLPSEKNPVVSFTLPDNSLATILLPPVIPNSAALSIRRFTRNPITIDQLIQFGAISPEMLQFLKGSLEAGLNIMVCGHLGSGANTLVNVLSSFIPGDERVISIEYEHNFSLRVNHLIKLIANEDPSDQHSFRRMLSLTEKLRGDRLVLGEFYSPEAYDALNKINDHYWGSIIRVVAKSPSDAVHRVETLIQMDKPHMPVSRIRQLIASSIDLIAYMARLPDGTRAVTNIVEVLDEEDSGEQVVLKEIFGVVQTGVKDGRILRKFVSPEQPSEKLTAKIERAGINLPPSLFASGPAVEKTKEQIAIDRRRIKLSKGNYVFISYSNKDLKRVLALAEELDRNNFMVWLDKWCLKPGEDWSKGLEKGIKDAGAFIVVLTANSVDSAAVRSEILTAQDKNLPIIPVKMEACNIPIQIKTLQYIPYDKSDLPGTVSRISGALSKHISNQKLMAGL